MVLLVWQSTTTITSRADLRQASQKATAPPIEETWHARRLESVCAFFLPTIRHPETWQAFKIGQIATSSSSRSNTCLFQPRENRDMVRHAARAESGSTDTEQYENERHGAPGSRQRASQAEGKERHGAPEHSGQ